MNYNNVMKNLFTPFISQEIINKFYQIKYNHKKIKIFFKTKAKNF